MADISNYLYEKAKKELKFIKNNSDFFGETFDDFEKNLKVANSGIKTKKTLIKQVDDLKKEYTENLGMVYSRLILEDFHFARINYVKLYNKQNGVNNFRLQKQLKEIYPLMLEYNNNGVDAGSRNKKLTLINQLFTKYKSYRSDCHVEGLRQKSIIENRYKEVVLNGQRLYAYKKNRLSGYFNNYVEYITKTTKLNINPNIVNPKKLEEMKEMVNNFSHLIHTMAYRQIFLDTELSDIHFKKLPVEKAQLSSKKKKVDRVKTDAETLVFI